MFCSFSQAELQLCHVPLLGVRPGGNIDSSLNRLTNRELEVIELLGRGLGTKDVASELHLSVKTIETHRAHIKEKLSFSDANELVRFAVEWVVQREPD
jgi:DNA-binding NarL/FixJ family response regulator